MLQPGDVFAGYTIERLLGQGGMGAVYQARHPRLPRQIALKLLNRELFADSEIRARFEREADLVAQLDHPNLVTVFDRGTEDDQLWISMQYIDGIDAASVDPRTLPPVRAAQIIAETAAALDYAHRMNILHRDVKPANILLARTSGQERVLLTDFGIARPREDTKHLTRTGSFTATLAFAAPEQLTGAHLDHRTDQYSLACSLYWLLSGTAPFESPHMATVIQGHLQQQPPPLSGVRPGLPRELDDVLARALAKRPGDRYDSCAEFAAAVQRVLSGAPVAVAAHTPRPMPQPAPPYAGSALPAGGYGPQSAQWPASGYPPSGYPAPARRQSSGGRVALTILGVICALIAGCGIWVWQDETTWVSQLTNRSKGHKDLQAMADAFPQMLPSDIGKTGTGYQGTQCQPAPQWRDFYATKGGLAAFDHWVARWNCMTMGDGKLAFRFYSFDSWDKRQQVFRTLEATTKTVETRGVGANRIDTHYIYKDEYDQEVAIIVSSFTDDSRKRWLLTFLPAIKGAAGLEQLVQRVREAPLS
ncbi:serine/threonine-protein kinase [Nocardia sp. NPDC051832]|uniref:serine/threonine-protein kinase n=1 Tax=Nocardia sp. NPDC051832 TaxID=3155673 RepID=UPI003430AE5E